ncbi:restriction endonuclease subunit S [Acinetobacter nosocomialis]|uniref:restriction endonuclease subunit S n=2 Tax=Acinetobacter nosocomialis TaxID=106654 RepID=UPI0011240B81|nr:restriction endonuclease subunit S [Acinetobacter nosocomialis]
MAKYQKYVEYKDSGCEWTDKLPIHWNSVHLKWISIIYAGGTPSKTIESYWENGTIPWINSGAVNQTYILEPSTYITQTAYENSSAKWIPQKALVMALAGQGKTKGMVAQLGINTTCNQSMGAIIPNDLSYARYLFWWITSNYQNIRNMAGGDLRDGLNLEHLGDMDCPLPNDEEIKKIANFLDHETTKIDTLIAKQEKLIELLKEKRQTVISHAVTKGLNPKVAMKDSGVEWLGQVPLEWMVSRLGYETWIRARLGWKGLKADEYVDDGYIFLATPNIKGKQIDFNNVNYINKQRYEESPEIKLNIGDILLTKDGSTLGTVNIVRDLPKPATVNSSIAVITPYKNLTSEFLLYLLTSSFMVNTIQRIKGGMGVPHLFQADLNKFYIPIPELAEQFEIVKFLDQETAKIDTLILKAESAIQLMQERRTALISAAVTGKIDVRHWQSPNKNNNQDNMELSA